jgi:hypothetical protein
MRKTRVRKLKMEFYAMMGRDPNPTKYEPIKDPVTGEVREYKRFRSEIRRIKKAWREYRQVEG